MRRAIGERMAASWAVAPMVTHHVRADVHELRLLLAKVNEGRAERERISITAAVVMAAAKALREVPRLNATLDGDVIRIWHEIDVGVAVAVDDGLIVPVVRGADRKGLGEISREVAASRPAGPQEQAHPRRCHRRDLHGQQPGRPRIRRLVHADRQPA